MGTKRHVVVPSWPGRPPAESIAVARQAQRLGYGAVWLGETSTFDAGVLAGRITGACPGLPLVVGPLPAPLRSGPQLAMLATSLASLGSPAEIVLGASQAAITRGWHGRGATTTGLLRDLLVATRAAASGARTDLDGAAPSHGFMLRLPARPLTVGLAGLGPARLELAGEIADRVVVNMVPIEALPRMLAHVAAGAERAGRPTPPTTAWVIAGSDPSPAAMAGLRRFVAAYTGAGGYGEVFRDLGFGADIDAATRDGRPSGGTVSTDLVEAIAAVGEPDRVRERVAAYEAAGVHVAVTPLTLDDPAGARTLRTLAPAASDPPATAGVGHARHHLTARSRADDRHLRPSGRG